MTTLRLAALLLLASTQAAENHSLPEPQTAVATPGSPGERLALARKLNGLREVKVPWHLKADYQWIGPDGHPKDQGVYEEWRVDAKQYRIAFHGQDLDVNEYGTEAGVFRSGTQIWPRMPLSQIPGLIDSPFASSSKSEQVQLKNFESNFGAGKMPCTAVITPNDGNHMATEEDFCFAPSDAVVFYAADSQQTSGTLFQNFMMVSGHYLAHDITLLVNSKPWLKLHVDTVLPLSADELAAMKPPENAQQVAPWAAAFPGETVEPGHRINRPKLEYPAFVKAQHVEGAVVLSCIVDKSGHPKDLLVIAGPVLLQKPAIEYVRQSVWSPFTANGQPVEYETKMTLTFKLH